MNLKRSVTCLLTNIQKLSSQSADRVMSKRFLQIYRVLILSVRANILILLSLHLPIVLVSNQSPWPPCSTIPFLRALESSQLAINIKFCFLY